MVFKVKIALISIDNRQNERTYRETTPRFGTGVDSIIDGVSAMPELTLHIISCTQQPMQSPEKLAPNIWFHCLHVPKFGWMRTLYQGCVRAMRKKFREVQPDVVYGVGMEREGAVGAVFSGFPNVVAMAGNMTEQARLVRAGPGCFFWLAAKMEKFLLPRTGGVICNSRYMQRLVEGRARRNWLIYPGMRGVFLVPPVRTSPRERALVIAGVISARKRQVELLNVAEELRRRGLKFEFRFIGLASDEPYTKEFLHRIKPLEASGCARYLGMPTHAEMVQIFDAASGMIHFPTEEAFGSVVAEGFARDLKFFGARTGGIVEIADGTVDAELFGTDDWASLTGSIAAWIAKGCPSAPGNAAIMAQRYSPQNYVQQHLQVFQEVIRKPKN
ncbi:MAG TPA: glycosyltransferase [Candidatus Acidoferrales bacterium]|nr:glycosyltransferase [Candidatus Acidoferrales bacterium]